MTDKKVVGKLDMQEVEPHILAILEHIIDTYNLIYQTRGISNELPLRIGHIVEDKFIDIENRQHLFHALPKYDVGMLLHILSIYSESDIIGDEELIDEDGDQWIKEKEEEPDLTGIGFDKDIKE
jgi:hypothetical protein